MLRLVVLINCYIPPMELFTEHFTNKLVFEVMAQGDACLVSAQYLPCLAFCEPCEI